MNRAAASIGAAPAGNMLDRFHRSSVMGVVPLVRLWPDQGGLRYSVVSPPFSVSVIIYPAPAVIPVGAASSTVVLKLILA